jgi:hypothetical protein
MVISRLDRCWPLVVLAAGLFFEPGVVGGKEPGGAPAAATLRLVNGDFIEGELQESGGGPFRSAVELRSQSGQLRALSFSARTNQAPRRVLL